GHTTQDVTMNLVDPGVSATDSAGRVGKPVVMPLTFQGDINLVNLKELLRVSLPPQLVAKFIPDRKIKDGIVQAFPGGIPITMKGTTTKPEVDIGDVGKRIGEGLL